MTENGITPMNEEIQWLRNFDQDDEFFHVTCHIDENLKTKISRGEYVDLDKLLPKSKTGIMKPLEEDSLFKFGVREGQPFVTASNDSNSRITSVWKWDQAFRSYATIYTQANQSRATEIWQYVYVIHTAAASFPWENVYFYDCTFRQLMA